MNDVRAAFCPRKEPLYALRHRLRPVQPFPSGKKPFLCPRSGLCAPGVRPAEQAALGLCEASPAPLNAHRLASAAADFAAKEAFLKAAGTGLREPFSLCEIEAVRQENGAPAYRFSGQTAAWVAQHRLRARLSLSHEGGMALAFCTLEEES